MEKRILVIGFLAIAAVTALQAQEKPAAAPGNASGNTTPAIALPRELELEELLQVEVDRGNYLMDERDKLQLQVQQLQNVVSQVLDNMRADRSQKADAAREAVGRKLVKQLGGDWEKHDRWDWRRRGMQRGDGTFVPLSNPDEKKSEAKQ